MANTFDIKVDDADVRAAFGRLNAALNNPSGIHAQIAELLLQQTKDRFAKGVSPEGQRWLPKSLATIEAQRRGDGKKRNKTMDTRPLFGPSKRLSNEILAFHGRDAAAVGSNMIYAAVQQMGAKKGAFGATKRGSPIPWGNIPARPFLGLGRQDSDQIVSVLGDWLQQIIAGKSGA